MDLYAEIKEREIEPSVPPIDINTIANSITTMDDHDEFSYD